MIGYYVHHHGTGHLTRATVVARACAMPVVAVSSLPEPAAPHPFAGWVRLAPDPALDDAEQPTAGGALHWAPLDSPGYAERMRELVRWCAEARPAAVVVDLSVEVAALLRLAGVPVAVMTLPGRRDDRAHELAYRLASLIVAPWPRAVYNPPHLHPFAGKTLYAGAMSRFDEVDPPAPVSSRRLLGVCGGGGGVLPAEDVARAAATVGWTGHALGGDAWTPDVQAEFTHAQVVVTHAGSNALAEVAALRRPAIVLAQDRPFGEQHATAAALDAAGIATSVSAWPDPDAWPGLIAAAVARGGTRWARWNDGRGAQRVADALRRLVAA